MPHDATDAAGASKSVWLTLFLCALTALLEGWDIQSGGLAAPKLRAEFGLDPSQLGLALSMSIFGLLVGALGGGRLSDIIGKKPVLVLSVAILGVFTLLTTIAWDYASLLTIRFLTGLGMGGAFPCLISIAAEAVTPKYRATGVSLMYAGIPLGGALASALATYGGEAMDWRAIFYFGGFGPVILVPFLLWVLPKHDGRAAEPAARATVPLTTALFGEGRAAVTLLLWVSYLCTLVVLYLLLNWLPSLLVEKGLTRPEAFAVSLVMNLAGAAGSIVLGMSFDRVKRVIVAVLTYVGMITAMATLASVSVFSGALVGGVLAGFFIVGGQALLYALAPSQYPFHIRGTGVGSAVAVGRVGSVAGPLIAGQLLSSGFGAGTILAMAIPTLALGGLAVARLAGGTRVDQPVSAAESVAGNA